MGYRPPPPIDHPQFEEIMRQRMERHAHLLLILTAGAAMMLVLVGWVLAAEPADSEPAIPHVVDDVPPHMTETYRRVDSTAYCLSGTTASGQSVGPSVVAMNGVPLGTRVRIISGPLRGQQRVVLDRIGHSSQFDVWVDSCHWALNEYGRRAIWVALDIEPKTP